ncbi:MAG: rifampicin phosphotransferase [Solirubrobacteraceae bacterium]|nr:rifampicin phosphotransferase [Solirubrobacteraceae bacterium]
MTFVESTPELKFEPPGPGPWNLDPVHFPRPVTRYWAEMHPEPFKRGCAEFASYYGMLIDGLETGYVNGFAYNRPAPVPEEEIPQRFQRAEEVWAGKLWRDQLRDWDETFKPASIAKHRELQSVDPDALSDEELAEYLTTCREHHSDMIYQHMRHTGAALIAIGDLLAHAGDWTGVSPAELLGMTRGAAPVSAGVSGEFEAMVTAVKADPEAHALLESDGDPGTVLAELRSLDSDAGRAVSAYLELTGYRLLDGFDISGRYALELPDALLRAIRAAVAGADDVDTTAAEVEAKIAEVRAKVPEEHRDEFDEMLGEARLMYRIRDERGVFSDIWASGIMRRAAIGAGRRVAARGRIHDPEHFVDAGHEEMLALVLGTNGPSADELAERHDWRTTHNAKEAPRTLGPPMPPPPDPSGLPPGVARVMRAVGITLDALFGSSTAEHSENVLRGFGASGGVYEGTARRVSGPTEFDRIVKGDVLLTESTTEAFNILLPLLGAIVTDSGGLLSHSAIVAREYGIPGVVGTRDATDRIPDGARVRVDGDAAEVTVLE